MTSFKAVVREHHRRKDGRYAVTIRLTHNRKSVYMPTGLYCSVKQISKRAFEIKDPLVIERTNKTIQEYERKLLDIDTLMLLNMTADELRTYLMKGSTGIDYLGYCKKLIEAEPDKWGALRSALHIIEDEMGYKKMLATDFTAGFLRDFKRTMDSRDMEVRQKDGAIIRTGKMKTKTKAGYLKMVCAAFRRLREEVNTEFNQVIRHDPFIGLEQYKKEVTRRRAMTVEELRTFFSYKDGSPRNMMTRDVMMISFCMCGINVADLWSMTGENYDKENGRINYERQKTRGARYDNAYSSIRIEPEIEELMKKYMVGDGEKLFRFYSYPTLSTLDRSLGHGVKEICEKMKLPDMSPYWFRHTWATIARNDCDISKDDIDLCLNHTGNNPMADVYIKPDWSRIDRANRKVLDYVFKENDKKA